jgi:hypothetical protein
MSGPATGANMVMPGAQMDGASIYELLTNEKVSITAAVPKTDPWAGEPKGMTSDWRLEIRAADQSLLASVPLDVTPFATDAAAQHRPLRVEGCIVIDSRIAMLVNAPRFAEAASYTFHRGNVLLGTTSAEQVAKLAGGGR